MNENTAENKAPSSPPQDAIEDQQAPQASEAPAEQAAPADSAGGAPAPVAAPPAPSVGDASSIEIDDATQAEIDAAMSAATGGPADAPKAVHDKPKPEELEAAHAAAQPKAIRGPRVVQGGREYRTGIVVSVGPSDIFIEFGPKELGVLPRTQFKDEELPGVGEEMETAVERFDRDEGLFICTRPGAVQKADWEMLEPGQVVEARVTGVNKGGLELEVAKHRAFMPASQVDTRRIEDLSVFVGEKMACKVTKVDRTGRGNILLSRRDIVAGERKAALAEAKESLKEGQTIEGVVRKIMPFGAFVDMGGVDGLLHVSDLSHDRVTKVEDVVKEGDKVTVQVLKLDWDSNRHSLGLKQLQEDPYATATEGIKEGEEVEGKVTKLMEFGAFVEIAPGVEGLVHISELAWQRVQKTSDVVQPGKQVKVKILKVDTGSRKVSLSMKQCSGMPMPKGMKPRGGGRGRGRGEEDTRSPDEILKETPALRRAREKAKQQEKQTAGLRSGLGDAMGEGLGGLKLPS